MVWQLAVDEFERENGYAKQEMGVAGVTWPCMSKPKAAISSWASPSDEVSTVSDIDEGKRMAALRWRSCCWWDLAYGTSLQSPPAALGRQQKKLLLASFTQQKGKKNRRREVARLVGKWRAAGGAGEWQPRGEGLHAWLPCR